MKKFKKIIATLLVVLSFATLLAGCSKKTECDICEEVKKCNSKKIMGEKIWICDDCQVMSFVPQTSRRRGLLSA